MYQNRFKTTAETHVNRIMKTYFEIIPSAGTSDFLKLDSGPKPSDLKVKTTIIVLFKRKNANKVRLRSRRNFRAGACVSFQSVNSPQLSESHGKAKVANASVWLTALA